ncbi:hypothetical protein DFH94DRAFT_697046 [Russula ochroleuca]|uniref:Uncharacterized protein n=1 Tax=Russula ochroleuca TaxID=152965 RepID=A0A9P5MQZ4_9AGAM|nr:hypothetical protein DFH94DRAFT_697046 [Russula ochroleuca]
MSPFDLGVFPEEGSPTTVTPKPVIRLVLAVASPEAGVIFREEPERKSLPDLKLLSVATSPSSL